MAIHLDALKNATHQRGTTIRSPLNDNAKDSS
jgi:hypothetical protein